MGRVTGAKSRALAISTVGAGAARAAGALAGVLSARLLGPEGKGQYALVVLAATVAGTLASAGLEHWVAREVARRSRPDEAPEGPGPAALGPVVRRHLVLSGAALAVLTLVAAVAVPAARATTGEVLAGGALAVATVVSMLLLAVPHGRLRMGVVAVATTAGAVTFVAWNGVLLATGTRSVALAILGAAVAAVVIAGVALAGRGPDVDAADHRGKTEAVAGPARTHRQALRFGVPASVGEVIALAAARLDVVLVALLLDRRAAGLYVVALALGELLLVLPDGIALVVLPSTARAEAQGPAPVRVRTGRLLRWSVAAMAGAAVVMAVLGGAVLELVFGPAFSGARAAVPAVLAGAVGFGAWKILAADLTARGRPGDRAWSAALGLAVMVLAELALAPRLGLAGAAAGSAIGSFTAAGALLQARRRALRRLRHPSMRSPVPSPRPVPANRSRVPGGISVVAR